MPPPPVVGGVGFVVRKEVNYFDYPMKESVQGWRNKWFYLRDPLVHGRRSNLPPFKDVLIAQPKKSWQNALSPEERAIADKLFDQVVVLKNTGGLTMCGTEVVSVFLQRRVQPLMSRPHQLWLYTGKDDKSRVSSADLSADELRDEVSRLTCLSMKDNIVLTSARPPYDLDHLPTEASTVAQCYPPTPESGVEPEDDDDDSEETDDVQQALEDSDVQEDEAAEDDAFIRNRRHAKCATIPNDKSGLGFNSNNKNKSKSKSNKKKGQDKVKDPAKLVCFKCKVEGHHVRSCPLKKKKHLSEKQQGKRPQGQGQAHARPQVEDRPLPKKNQDIVPQEKKSIKKKKGNTCYLCREKGHFASSCLGGTLSNPIIVDDDYSLGKDKDGNVFAKFVGTQSGFKKRTISVAKPIVTNLLGPNLPIYATVDAVVDFAEQFTRLESENAQLWKTVKTSADQVLEANRLAIDAKKENVLLKEELKKLKRQMKDEQDARREAAAAADKKEGVLRESIKDLLEVADITITRAHQLREDSTSDALSLAAESNVQVLGLLQKTKGALSRLYSMIFPKKQDKTLGEMAYAFLVDSSEPVEVLKRRSRLFGAVLTFQLLMGYGMGSDLEKLSKALLVDDDNHLVDPEPFKRSAVTCANQLLKLVDEAKTKSTPEAAPGSSSALP
ncbi:hypothetical protein QYE76_006779 [Lolium multiflorum]|uniref:CCHC-type domain-containing protein n=1 Tax=Lolium multiflorum TaxID=4521 RepID=A0AAD8W3N0_LOLMU|nr:hypothetical protein QYE76_006779 [Lolium multiflorum]